MTDEELKRLDALCEAAPRLSDTYRARIETTLRNGAERKAAGHTAVISMELETAREMFALATMAEPEAMRAALAEIRRLRGLVKHAEASGVNISDEAVCPWCECRRFVGGKEPHAPDCPAFTPDGQVK